MELFDLARYGVLPKNKKILLFEAFSGIGTQAMAFERLKELIGIDYEVVGFSEIDKYAIMSYHAIHGEHLKNYGDISKIEQLPKCDVCTWSFPCQDISLAGHQKGMVEGTRSNYGFDFIETVRRSEHKPKILIMENVKALVSERFQDDFKEIQERLKSMGYENHWKVLNSKHYGVAQNRERVFMISILGGGWFQFPPKVKLTKCLKDYLEDEVDEKYYLDDNFLYQMTKEVENYNRKDKFLGGVSQGESIARTITTKIDRPESNYILIPEKTKQGYVEAHDGDGVYINRPHQKRGVVQKQMIQTIKTSGNDIGVVVEDKKINIYLTLVTTFGLCGIIDVKDGVKYEDSRTLLRILWKEIGKKEVYEEIRRFYGVYETKILRQNVHEEGIFKDRDKRQRLWGETRDSEEHKQPYTEKDNLRNMWEQIKCGYTPQRWELEEQQFRELDNVMSELPHEITQEKQNVQDMWASSKGAWVLQQTLHSLQEIWGSVISQKQSKVRIRKLTARECFRLMDISDDDYDKASKVCSNSQLYKQAGNAIVVNVLVQIFKNLIE